MADMNFDFSGTRRLYSWCLGFNTKYDHFIDEFTKDIGLKALRETKKATPVGVHPENVAFWARKSASNSELNLVELNGVGMSGGTLRNSWKITGVRRRGNDRQIAVYADSQIAPYAFYVEHGHRTVAFNTKGRRKIGWFEGRHMARDSILSTEKQIPIAYDRAFDKFIKSLRL